MKAWVTSRTGAITISALALLSFIGYALMEMRYFLGQWIPGEVAAMVETIVVLLIVGGWLRALFVAAAGRRSGWTGLFVLSALAILIGVYDLQFVLNTPMPWPEQLMVIVMLIAGLITAATVGVYLRVNVIDRGERKGG